MSRIERELRDMGAVLLRQNRHLVYRLPNGRNYVMSKSPSDKRAEINMVKVLYKVASQPSTQEKAHERHNTSK